MEPKYRFVDDSFGYNSLYPLIFHLIPANAPELDHILRRIKDPEVLNNMCFFIICLGIMDKLWTTISLQEKPLLCRSQYRARSSILERVRLTFIFHWCFRYIWVNLNYLILSALQHYATISGPFQHLCQQLSADLRQNIINNMATVSCSSNQFIRESR